MYAAVSDRELERRRATTLLDPASGVRSVAGHLGRKISGLV